MELMEFGNSMDLWKLFLVLTLAATVGMIILIVKYRIYQKRLYEKLPGRKVRFIDLMGNLADFTWTKEGRNGFPFNVFFMQVAHGYGYVFRKEQLFCYWLSFFPFIVFNKAEAAEALIGGTKNMQKNWCYDFLHPWLGTGLLTSHGSKWKSRRKMLTPCFHFEILRDFLPVFNEQSQVLVKCLQKEITKDFTDIVMPITLCSLDIICETTLGTAISAQEDSDSEYVKSVSRIGDIIMERAVNCLYWFDFTFGFTEKGKEFKSHLKVLHDFTRSVIQKKKKKLLSGDVGKKRKRMALMDLLLERHVEAKDLSEDDIREEVDTFAFEGHDTTSMALIWALYLIGLNKDVEEKVHEELDEIFGDDVERPVNTDDLADMKYLERVLKETQRLYPSVPGFLRQASEDQVICGSPIPKGTSCVVLITQLHRDQDVFPNPEKFDPDRFLPENSNNRHPFAYIPFSSGPRNCIGQRFAVMEMKVVVSSILRNYTIESLDHRDKLPATIEIVQRPCMPVRVRIRPRQRSRS